MSWHQEVKPIPGYSGYFANAVGEVFSNRRGQLKKLKASWNGRYYNVSARPDNGRHVTSNLHVLVCLAFHGPRPNEMVCRHSDDDPHNNRADNLSWGTQTENNRDRVKNGSIPRGERHHKSKLREWEVAEIRAYAAAGVREKVLATAYSVSQSAIKHIRHRRSHAVAA